MHRIITLALAVTVLLAVHSAAASAAVRHIDAACGIHRGRLVIAGGVDHRYHVRVGPKHAGGRARCHGRVHHWKHTSGNGLAGSWFPFDLGAWSWRGVLDVGATSVFTASACSTFAAAMIGEIPTAGIDSPATIITGAACVAGGKQLQDTIRTQIRPRG